MEKRHFAALWFLWFAPLFLFLPITPALAQDPPVLAQQLVLAEEQGDYLAAVEILRRQLADKPDDLDLLTRLARHQRAAGDLERAAETLGRVAQLAGKASADVLEVRGDIARAEGRPADALSDYQLALRAAPDCVRVLEKIAAHHLAFGEPDSAAIYYTKLTTLREQSGDHLQLARASLRRRDWNAMVDHLSAASALSEGRVSISNYETLFSKAVQLGRYDRRIKSDPKDIRAILDRAELFHSCKLYDEALEDAKRAARIDSRAPHVRLSLAFYYAAAGDSKKGAELNVNTRAMKGSSLIPSYVTTLVNHDRHVRETPGDTSLLQERAKLLIANQQVPLALEDIERALASDPDSVSAQLLKADALELTHRPAEARQLVRQLAKKHPDHADVLQEIGSIQMADGLYENAITTFEKILAQRPGYEQARDGRTLCYKRLQRQPPTEQPQS